MASSGSRNGYTVEQFTNISALRLAMILESFSRTKRNVLGHSIVLSDWFKLVTNIARFALIFRLNNYVIVNDVMIDHFSDY